MVIYGNNLAEKLFGIAINKDYLRYATPYCELVDDPDFVVDIDLAVDLNSALEGDGDAARRCVETLILNSAILDASTIDFYVDKMMVHPYFEDEIRRINDIFNDPDFPNFKTTGGAGTGGAGTGGAGTGGAGSGGGAGNTFLDALSDAAQDCINSPCNLFAATSDSVGRMAQAASTKTSENTFDLDSLAGTATNLINGLDQTIFNSIPAAFQQGSVEVTTAAKQSWTNAQAVFMGKGDIAEAASFANNTGSMRSSTDKIFSFSPDIKSFFDFDQLGPAILAEAANTLGGCFDRFQNAYRYNPYKDNNSTPLGYGISQVNGKSYSHDPAGTYSVLGVSRSASGDVSQFLEGGGSTGVQIGKGVKLEGEGYYVSIPLVQKTEAGKVYSTTDGWPFMVGSYIKKPMVIRADSISGIVNSGEATIPGVNICPGVALNSGDGFWIESSESSNEEKALNKDKKLKDVPLIAHKISNDWKHQVDEPGMTTPQENPIFDDGAILNKMIVDRVKMSEEGDPIDIVKSIRDNKAFLVIREAGKCAKIVRVIGYQPQDKFNQPVFGLTPAAYKYVYNVDPKGAKDEVISKKPAVKAAGWEVYKAAVVHTGDTEIRVAVGDYGAIKAAVEKEIECNAIEVFGGWRDYFTMTTPNMYAIGNSSANAILGTGGTVEERQDRHVGKMDPLLVRVLIEMSIDLGIKLQLNSGIRNYSYMANSGQAGSYRPGSLHNISNGAKAADIRFSGASRGAFKAAAEKAIAKIVPTKQGGIGMYSSFIHVDVRGSKARW